MRFPGSLGIAVAIAIPICVSRSQEPPPDMTSRRLWAAQINPTTMRFVWDEIPGAASYRISCQGGGRAERVLGSMPASQITTYAGGVPRRASHAIPIRPTDLGVEYRCSLEWRPLIGEFSGKTAFNPVTPVPVTIAQKTISPAPAFATATSSSENEITLTWAAVPGATAYTINREVAPSGFNPFCDVCPATSTTIVDRFTEKSRKHRYFVTAIMPGGAGQRAMSNYVVPGVPPDTTPVTPATPIVPPASVTATVTGATSAKASWIAVRGPIAYELSRYIGALKASRVSRVPNDMTGVLIEVPEKFVVDPKAASVPLTVHYSVRSIGADGKVSDAVTSNTVTVSAKEAAAAALAARNVTNPHATAMSGSSVVLTWTPPAGTYVCNLERSLSGSAFSLIARVPIGAYRYIDDMPELMTRSPRYRITCSAGKVPLPAVAFPNPTPPA